MVAGYQVDLPRRLSHYFALDRGHARSCSMSIGHDARILCRADRSRSKRS